MAQTSKQNILRIGIIVNEFFCDDYPPLGGFGLSAKNFAEFFNSRPQLGIEVVALMPPYQGTGPAPSELHGTRIVEVSPRIRDLPMTRKKLRAEGLGMLICVDYYPNYFTRLVALPRTPWIHWARDPHSPENWDKILTLIGTGYPCEYNENAKFRFRHYGQLQFLRRLLNRKFCCAVQETWLAERAEAGFPLIGHDFARLVNRIMLPPEPATRTGPPKILFIGRLVPVKRPWVYFEIARRLPDYQFRLVGEMDKRKHLTEIVAAAKDIPNLEFLGARTGADLHDVLNDSWILVNTSIHEGMPQSILETLAFGVPVVSSLDYAGTIETFGVSVGLTDGDGMIEVDAFCEAITDLVEDSEKRTRLGGAGRQFVGRNYSDQAFLQQFVEIMEQFGIPAAELHGADVGQKIGAESEVPRSGS